MNYKQRLRRAARLLIGDPEAAALFECLAEHLFDPALDTSFMGRICGAPRLVRERLAAKIGPLKDFVTTLRMMEAAHLVRNTTLPIQEIGRRVGYPVARSFRRAFVDAHGVLPSEMRRQARATAGKGDESALTDASENPRTTTAATVSVSRPPTIDGGPAAHRARARRIWRQHHLGLLNQDTAAELKQQLRQANPRLEQLDAEARTTSPSQPATSGPRSPVLLTSTGDWLEEIAANQALGEIVDLPPADQRFALLEGLRMGHVTAFFQLFRFCEKVVQFDSEKALRLARLGVELIEPHREQMLGEADHWKALAWVKLSRIQLHAGDCGGADLSLSFALAEVGGEQGLEPWVEIELREAEGCLRKQQRRYDEARSAFDRAVELGRELEPGDLGRQRSVLHRLALASAEGDAEAGFALIRELDQLLDTAIDGERPAGWKATIFLHGAKAWAARGHARHAEHCLRQAMQDIIADPECDTDESLGILFTYVIHELARVNTDDEHLEENELFLRHAVDRYRRFQFPMLEAAAEAELAVVVALRGDRDEARKLATSAADFLDDLPPLHREAWQAARRLRAFANSHEAHSEDELQQLLTDLRRDLDLASWEITGPQALPAVRLRLKKAETLST